MASSSARRTGRAILWRAVQLGGDKLVNLVRLLVLARLLAPEDFGLLALSAIAIDVSLRVTDTGMTPALVQRAESHRRYYDVAWTVQISRALLVGLALLALAPLIADVFGEPRAAPLLRIMAFRVIVQGLVSIRVAELHRNLRFGALTAVYLGEVVVGAVATVFLASRIGVLALAIGPLLAAGIQVVTSYIVAPYRPRVGTDSHALRSLLGFGKWIFAEGVIAVSGASVLQLIISRRLGLEELGVYYLATRLAFLPSVISSELVGVVVFPLFARMQGDLEAAGRAMRTTLLSLAAVVFPMALFLSALADPITVHLLGSRWEGTAPLIQFLSLVGAVGVIGDVMMPLFKGLGRPRHVVAMIGVEYALLCLLASFLLQRYGLQGAAITWMIAVAAAQIVGVILMRRVVPLPFASLAPGMIAIAAVAAVGAFVASGVASAEPGRLGLLFAVVAGGGLTVILMAGADRVLRLGVAENLRSALPR